MAKKTKRKKWSKTDLKKLAEFIQQNASTLISNFYQNIKSGYVKLRKPSGFFIEMGKSLKLTSAQCKSKFQKFEKEIYTAYIGFPEVFYDVLESIRKTKKMDRNFSVRSFSEVNEVKSEIYSSDSSFEYTPKKKKKNHYMVMSNLIENKTFDKKTKQTNVIMDNEKNEQIRKIIIELYDENIKNNPQAILSKKLYF